MGGTQIKFTVAVFHFFCFELCATCISTLMNHCATVHCIS